MYINHVLLYTRSFNFINSYISQNASEKPSRKSAFNQIFVGGKRRDDSHVSQSFPSQKSMTYLIMPCSGIAIWSISCYCGCINCMIELYDYWLLDVERSLALWFLVTNTKVWCLWFMSEIAKTFSEKLLKFNQNSLRKWMWVLTSLVKQMYGCMSLSVLSADPQPDVEQAGGEKQRE